MESNSKKHARQVLIFIIGAFMLGGLSVYIWQQGTNRTLSSTKSQQIDKLQQELDKAVLLQQADDASSESGEPEKNVDENSSYAVAYEPDSKFTTKTKQEIESKLIRPYAFYYSDSNSRPVSFHLSESPDTNSYKILVIGKDGSYIHDTISKDAEETGEWWTPTCLNTCKFSEEFTSQFPEIVSQYQQKD